MAKRKPSSNPELTTRAIAAERLGTNLTAIKKIRIVRRDAPKLYDEVWAGDLTVTAAYNQMQAAQRAARSAAAPPPIKEKRPAHIDISINDDTDDISATDADGDECTDDTPDAALDAGDNTEAVRQFRELQQEIDAATSARVDELLAEDDDDDEWQKEPYAPAHPLDHGLTRYFYNVDLPDETAVLRYVYNEEDEEFGLRGEDPTWSQFLDRRCDQLVLKMAHILSNTSVCFDDQKTIFRLLASYRAAHVAAGADFDDEDD